MADIFLTVVPVYPTVPSLAPAKNVDRTSNFTEPFSGASRVAKYHARARGRVLATLPGGTEGYIPGTGIIPLGPPGGGTTGTPT